MSSRDAQAQYQQMSAKAAEALGLPTGFKIFSPFPFGGMDRQSSRIALEENEFWNCENLVHVGSGKLKALWDKGEPLYTVSTGRSIVYFYFYNIGLANYAIVFLDDGTAVQVDSSTKEQTVVSSIPNTFYTGGQLPICRQWGSLYLLIANNITPNSYWVWDGAILYHAGSLGPGVVITNGGSGYSSPPAVTAFGGSGSGISATATLSGGSVVLVTLTNPGTGYLPSDEVQFAFSGGGNSDTSAILTAVLTSLGVGYINIVDAGSGYTPGTYALGFSGGSGTGAAGTYTVDATHTVISYDITLGGSGYTSAPTVSFPSGGGTLAAAQAFLVTGGSTQKVSSATLTNQGSGYTPGTYALGFSGGGGSLAAGTYQVKSSGVVSSSITISNGGSGYTSPPTISFPLGGGSNAAATAVLSGQTVTTASVVSVSITDGGSGFTSAPTLSFVGGGGTGAVATANLTSGVITSVTVTAGGSGYSSSPAIVVQTAVNNAASAEATLMPYGISGSSLETYEQRVWLPYPNQTGNQENGGTMLVSSPGSLTDFAPSAGGLTYTSSDSFLRYQYTNIKQSNGYLYPIGDSSVEVISNVQTSGASAITTFNYQNMDPQIGTSWRDTVIDYSRTILLANPLGIYGVYGGSLTKISSKMDELFTSMILPEKGGVLPSGAVSNIYSQKVALMLMTIKDLYTGAPRNVMVAWNEKEWFMLSQSVSLTFIGSQEVNSNLAAWGTDGTSLCPLFNVPSSSLAKTLSTKLYGAQAGFVLKQAMSTYVQATDLTVAGTGVTFAATVDTENGSYATPNAVVFPAQTPITPPKSPMFPMESGDVVGVNLGMTLTSTSPDFEINHLMLGYVDVDGLFGSTNLTGEGE